VDHRQYVMVLRRVSYKLDLVPQAVGVVSETSSVVQEVGQRRVFSGEKKAGRCMA
jgi:hypothetical protein